jgi:hypothetical protein
MVKDDHDSSANIIADPILESELVKGLDSGSPTEVDDAYWARFRARYRERLRRRDRSLSRRDSD